MRAVRAGANVGSRMEDPPDGEAIRLPAPRLSGGVAVEQALDTRRSLREFAGEPLGLPELAQLLWAAQDKAA